MHSEELRKYLDIINENSEEVLTEGMLQKLAGLALGTVLALGPKIGQADTVYTYFDPGANKMQTVLDMSKVPASAKTVMAVDTDTQQVMLVRSGSPTAKEITPDPVAVKQAQFTKDTKSFSDEPQKSKSQAQTQSSIKNVEKADGGLIFSGYSIEEIKDKMIDKIQTEYPDADVEDKGRTLVSTRQGVHMKNFGAMFMTVLMKGGSGTADVITKYNFSKQGDKIKVVPFQQMRYTNAFGQPEVFDMKPSTKTLVDIWYKDFNDTPK